MAVSEGDDLDGVYAMAGYSTANMSDNNHYFGIRRIPYSVDFSRNDLTFRHIADDQSLPTDIPFIDFGGPNSEVHNAGEIWASMMFEAMVALLKESQGASPRYSFAEAHRRMGDYVVAGMLLAPQAPTFTEQRDAILAAALASDEQDFLVIAQAFARRGAGTGAKSPPRQSDDLIGVVESFDVLGDLAVVDVALRDVQDSCDGDGLLDHGETGTVTLSIMNPGAATLTGTTLSVTSATGGVTFPDGGSVAVPDLGPFDSFTTDVAVALAADATAEEVAISYVVANPAAATPEVAGTLTVRVHYDNLPASSSSDDVESDLEVWVEDGNLPAWAREAEADGNHVWRGEAPGELADVSLVSPPLMVGDEPFTMVFKHRHQFEQSDGTNWDGGVIELSSDDGVTWQDISNFATPGYGGPLTGESGNPLADRQAFVGQSAAFPAFAGVSLDLGTALAGQTVRVRFRVATDAAVGDLGWTVDDLVFGGLLNTPFPTTPLDDGVCTGAPRASAGPDRAVFAGANVRLDGSASEDTDGGVLTFSWAQTGGDEVALAGADGATPTFVAPMVTESTPLTFTLTVSDGERVASDSVTINVAARLGPGGDGDDEGGCGCRVGGEPRSSGSALGVALLAFAVMLRRRRR
jgi:MYXO-CTERM domain-containing protein